MFNISDLKTTVKQIIQNEAMTNEQVMMALSSVPFGFVEFFETSAEFRELFESGVICTMTEGNATYQPRYILPDYEKLMREGCSFLRLDPPKNLEEAILTLEVFYRHVPSVTHYPVYLGSVDKLLEPFLDGIDEQDAYRMLRNFLFYIDRTISDSYCHMNLGPEETRAGRMILEIQKEMQNAIPSITMLYDPEITPDSYAELAVECALVCAKPSFANHQVYQNIYTSPYGIASCYNALPIGGGSFTLSRIVLAKLAERAKDSEHLLEDLLPRAVRVLCEYIEKKICFLVEETQFFKSNFLVQEGFIRLENFTGMFGVVGMNECVNTLLQKEGKEGTYGHSAQADELAKKIMERLTACVKSYESKYCNCTDHHFSMHAQVGISEDNEISPGVRIAIGSELPLYDHLRHCGQLHPYFESGVGDIFPFDETAKRNPAAIVDLVKGSFALGMRYFSTYSSDSDVIRITGYLVKKSDIEKLAAGKAVQQANATWGLGEVRNSHVLDRKVRSLS